MPTPEIPRLANPAQLEIARTDFYNQMTQLQNTDVESPDPYYEGIIATLYRERKITTSDLSAAQRFASYVKKITSLQGTLFELYGSQVGNPIMAGTQVIVEVDKVRVKVQINELIRNYVVELFCKHAFDKDQGDTKNIRDAFIFAGANYLQNDLMTAISFFTNQREPLQNAVDKLQNTHFGLTYTTWIESIFVGNLFQNIITTFLGVISVAGVRIATNPNL